MQNLSVPSNADQYLLEEETANLSGRRKKSPVLFPLQYRNRPPLVRVAIRLAADEGVRKGLHESAISVLQAIIACGFNPDRPAESVFAKKSTLARIAKVGEATVYRALKKLGESGFICRRIQSRQDDGTMDLSLINFSENFQNLISSICRQLNLCEGSVSEPRSDRQQKLAADSENSRHMETPDTAKDSAPIPDVIDGLIDGPYIEVNDRCTQSHSVCNQSTGNKHEEVSWKGKRYKLPVGLVWLWKEKNLQPTGIVKLMAMNLKLNARRDLEQLVELRRNNIQQLNSANACYRYVEALVKASIDAGFQLLREKRKAIAAQKASEIAAAKEACKTWAASRVGLMFSANGGEKTFEVTGASCRLVVGRNGMPSSTPSIPLTMSFIEAVERGTFKVFQQPVIEKGGAKALSMIANALCILKASGNDRLGIHYGR